MTTTYGRVAAALSTLPILALPLVCAASASAKPPTVKHATIHDPADASHSCEDIRTVRITATKARVSFTVVLAGTACASIVPTIFVDTNRDGASDCQTEVTNGAGALRCNGNVTGVVKEASSGSQWKMSFPLAAIGHKRVFQVQLAMVSGGNFDDLAPDGSEEATVKTP